MCYAMLHAEKYQASFYSEEEEYQNTTQLN